MFCLSLEDIKLTDKISLAKQIIFCWFDDIEKVFLEEKPQLLAIKTKHNDLHSNSEHTDLVTIFPHEGIQYEFE